MKKTVQLPKSFVDLIQSSLQQNSNVISALTGFYEGRNLTGEYELRITGAHLAPKKEVKK